MKSSAYSTAPEKNIAVVAGLNRPFFHLDLTSAVESAVKNIEVLSPPKGPSDTSLEDRINNEAEKPVTS